MLLNDYLKPHNKDIDELYHQLTCYNVLSTASFADFITETQHLDGDIVECGIGRSRSLIILSSLVIGLNLNKKIYAYDSFAGFPTPNPQDASFRMPKAGDWSSSPSGKYQYTPEFSHQVLKSAEIPIEKIKLKLVKGFFRDSLPEAEPQKISLLNIDGDLYESYKDCLTYLFPKVQKGGIILFDDFSDIDSDKGAFPGSRLAAKEYLGEYEYSKIQKNRYGVFYYKMYKFRLDLTVTPFGRALSD